MRVFITFSLCVALGFSGFSQSMYGYMGKRFYASGSLSAGPALVHRDINGDWGRLRLNLIGTFSGNIVLNKKQVLALNYKRYAGVASVHSEGEGLIYRQTLGDYLGYDIGDFRFTSSEFGFNYQFFAQDLDAPLGAYFSVGFGMVYSKYDVPFQILSTNTSGNSYGNSTNPVLLSFDNTIPVRSPIIRIGAGKQTVFWNRFLFNYGIDIGLNLGHISSQLGTLPFFSDSNSGQDLTQEELNTNSKKAIQSRVFMMNLFNFKMGLSYLIF